MMMIQLTLGHIGHTADQQRLVYTDTDHCPDTSCCTNTAHCIHIEHTHYLRQRAPVVVMTTQLQLSDTVSDWENIKIFF